MHSLYTHALTACSHTHHSITTQKLNDHGFTTHSPHTPPSPRSLPTYALTHTLQTHLLLNTLTILSSPTHHSPLQWPPHSLTHSLTHHAEHSRTQQTSANSTNTRGALTTHPCFRRSLTHSPCTHAFNMHSPCTHQALTH